MAGILNILLQKQQQAFYNSIFCLTHKNQVLSIPMFCHDILFAFKLIPTFYTVNMLNMIHLAIGKSFRNTYFRRIWALSWDNKISILIVYAYISNLMDSINQPVFFLKIWCMERFYLRIQLLIVVLDILLCFHYIVTMLTDLKTFIWDIWGFYQDYVPISLLGWTLFMTKEVLVCTYTLLFCANKSCHLIPVRHQSLK